MPASEVTQRFHRDVDADPVALLETVGHRLRRRVNPNLDLLQAVHLHTFGESESREARHTQPRVVELRFPRLLRQRDPHLGRRLRGQLVKTECSEQTEDTVWDSLGYVR